MTGLARERDPWGGGEGSTEVDLVVVVVECGCSWVASLRPSNMLVYLGTDLLRQLCVLPYSELPTVTFWPYFDTVTSKVYGNTVC